MMNSLPRISKGLSSAPSCQQSTVARRCRISGEIRRTDASNRLKSTLFVRIFPSLTLMMIVGLGVSAAATEGSETEVCGESGIQVVVISTDGLPRRATCEELQSEDPPPDMHHGWRWSASDPPCRVVPDEWLDINSSPEVAGTLALGLNGASKDDTSIAVIAGPQEMWQSVFEELLPRWSVTADTSPVLPRIPEVAWRLRVVSNLVASGWIDVPPMRSVVVVRVRPSKTLAFNTATHDGSPVEQIVARVFPLEDSVVGVARQPVAMYVGDRGRLVVESIPADQPLRVLFENGRGRGTAAARS